MSPAAILALVLALGSLACGSEEGEEEGDPTSRLGDVAAREDRQVPAGGEAASEPRGGAVTVPAATTFRVRLDSELGMLAAEGDTFTATTVEPLRGGERVAVPAGATLHGAVTAVQEAEGSRPGVLKIDFQQIELGGERVSLYATVVGVSPEVRVSRADTGGEAAPEAAEREVVGRIVGEDEPDLLRETVVAASGTAIVLGVPGAAAVLPAGSEVALRLDAELELGGQGAPRRPEGTGGAG